MRVGLKLYFGVGDGVGFCFGVGFGAQLRFFVCLYYLCVCVLVHALIFLVIM